MVSLRYSACGIMPVCWGRSSWLPVVFGVVLVALSAVSAGPSQDQRPAQASSCFGGFDLYFVLDQ